MPNRNSSRTSCAPLKARSTLARALLAVAAIAGVQAAHAAGPVITCASNPNIFNTAYDGATGVKPNNSADTYWQVTTMQPRTPNVAVPMSTAAEATLHLANVGNLIPSAWAASPYPTANWITNEIRNPSATPPPQAPAATETGTTSTTSCWTRPSTLPLSRCR